MPNKIPKWDDTEEIVELAPSWDDTEEYIEPEETSIAESTIRGGIQSATFELADEITGGAEALGRVLFGGDKLKDLVDNYRKYRDESRANYKSAEEANPMAYLAGEIGGGIGTGLLTGGAGAVANLGRVGAKAGAKELMKVGARQGAASGLGMSEADLTKGEVGGAIADTALGLGIGAGAGVLLPTVGKGAAKLASEGVDLAKHVPIIGNFLEAADLESKGRRIIGKGSERELTDDANKAAKELSNILETQYEGGSKKVGEALTSSDVKMDVSGDLNRIEDMIISENMPLRDLNHIEGLVNQFKIARQNAPKIVKKGSIDEKLIKGEDVAREKLNAKIMDDVNLSNKLGENVSYTSPELSDSGRRLEAIRTSSNPSGERVASGVTENIPPDRFTAAQSIIDYEPGSIIKEYKDMNLQGLQLLKKQFSSLAHSSQLDNFAKKKMGRAAKEVDELIKSKMTPEARALYEEGNKSISKVYKVSDHFKELDGKGFDSSRARIDLAEKIKRPNSARDQYLEEVQELIEAPTEELMSKIEDVGRRSSLRNQIKSAGTIGGVINPNTWSTLGGAITGKIIKTPREFAKRITSIPTERLTGIANRMQAGDNEGIKELGRSLNKALQSDKKDALLWSLSQQPAFRQQVDKLLDDVDFQSLMDSFLPPTPLAPQQPEQTQEESTRGIPPALQEQYRRR